MKNEIEYQPPVDGGKELFKEDALAACTTASGHVLALAQDVDNVTVAKPKIYLICHHYDIGDQSIAIKAPVGVDAKRIAVFIQFQAEEWFGAEKMVTNLGIAAAMVTFYGCKHAARSSSGEVIDMYTDREAMCGTAHHLTADFSLHRAGLRDFLSHHLDG